MGGEARISDYGDLQVDQLRFMAARHPDEDAYVDLVAGEGLTFAEWDTRSNRQVHFLDELPRNATGKVLKRELQATVNQFDERK